jgi:DNA repair exonuclease SbcCD nuclease subunit
MNKVDKIFHIADIHIRNLKRHKEYRKVFSNLYKEIKSRKTDNSLIVVAGDIAHSKTDMSPELVDMVNEFFTNLTKLSPTIIITGNHDCNLNNTYRLDVLSPIVESLNNKKLHYLKDSGVYNFGDVDFVVWSIYDEEENYIKAKDIDSDNKKIGLYHGPVNSARTDAGFSIYNNKVTVDMMEGFDMFLLGISTPFSI